uniref:Ubiquitin-like protease family profile domain-containing protein n=1 Tax=Brassica oleracea var. oleracea TaxID=109376 RepID=A0A0D3D5B7_BRAOL
MELEIPKRLYAEGLEPQVKKINNCCRMELIRDLKKAMSAEYNDVKIDPTFKHIMAIAENKLKFSGKLVDSFLCKQLITSKMHEKWFVFARTPLRFSLQEYHAVTGLKVSRESSSDVSNLLRTGDKITLKSIRKVHLKEVHKWTRIDRMRLVYLCVIMGVVMGRDEKVNIPDMYIKLVMDLDKPRKFHWGLHSYDFLLSSIEKARKKLGKKASYIFKGFSYALQIWIMEAIPGEICGSQVSSSFVGPRCGNWKGVAKVSYEDIIELEDSLTKKTRRPLQLRLREKAREKFLVKEQRQERRSCVNDLQKKKLTFGPETKSFIEGLIQTSVTSLGDMLSSRMANMERMFAENMGKMEIEVSQLRDAISLTAPPKSKANQDPPKSKGAQAPPKRKGDQPTPTKKDGKKIATETNDFDFGLSTQDLRDLSQDTYVEGFDLSQVKVETSRKSKPLNMAPLLWNDEQLDQTKEDSPDAALVFFREEEWEKVRTWSTSSTRLRIGPATLDFEIANRLMDKSEWVDSLQMYVFRERTSLKRWRPHRVAFMTVVFSNMIKKEYGLLEAQGRKNYTLHNLLLQYGKGVLPPHGRTEEIWNVDVDQLYVPVHVSGNHWIALCISFVTRSIDVFDCSGRKRFDQCSYIFLSILKKCFKEKIVKTKQSTSFRIADYVPVGKLNKSACDCGVYAVKFIECHALGLELSLLHDGNIIEARHRVLWDLWEAANEPELIERMSKYQSPECLSSTVEEIL